MAHPRVEQLRFARSEWQRGLIGLSEEDAVRRLLPMNSISWMGAHMAWHERLIWLHRAQGLSVEPIARSRRDREARDHTAAGRDAGDVAARRSRPPTCYLDGVTTADLEARPAFDTRAVVPVIGTQMMLITYHYWSHIGEASAVRQMLGHTDLPQWVGDLNAFAPYRREPA